MTLALASTTDPDWVEQPERKIVALESEPWYCEGVALRMRAMGIDVTISERVVYTHRGSFDLVLNRIRGDIYLVRWDMDNVFGVGTHVNLPPLIK